MKKRERGFISEGNIDHDGEIFDYIKELHEYLWKFVRVLYPEASGSLNDWLDDALEIAPKLIEDIRFMEDKKEKHRALMEKWLDVYTGGTRKNE